MADRPDPHHHKAEQQIGHHPKEGHEQHDPLAEARLGAPGDRAGKTGESAIEAHERSIKETQVALAESLNRIAQHCARLDSCGIDSKKVVADWHNDMGNKSHPDL